MLGAKVKNRSERARATSCMLRVAACILTVSQCAASPCRADSFPQPSARSGRAVWMHSDGTYESAYAWVYEGCQPPAWGSFAERYEGRQQVAAVALDVADDAYPDNEFLDVYVWTDDGGVPGEVLASELNVDLGDLPYWPNVGRRFVDLVPPACAAGAWWVGFWGRWPHDWAGFFIGADQNGPGGGTPKTRIAPGQQWPEGWQDIPLEWGPTAALGIGAEVEELPSPPESETWGAIKSLFRGASR